MHLAAALGAPVTAMFGPTDERVTGPRADPHVAIGGGRPDPSGLVPSVHAARVPARSRLHARHRGRGGRRRGDAGVVSARPGRVSRSRRHADRRGRLSRSGAIASSCIPGRSMPCAAESRRVARDRGRPISPASRADSSPRRSSTASTHTSRRCWRRAARASTRITIVRTIRTATSTATRTSATAGSRRAGSSIAPLASSASIRCDRSWSATGGWMCALARAVGARGVLVRTGYGAPRRPDRLPDAGGRRGGR